MTAAPLLTIPDRQHVIEAQSVLDLHRIRGRARQSWSFVVPGTPKTWPRPKATVLWWQVWTLVQGKNRRNFARSFERGGTAKAHLVITRKGDKHEERVDHIRNAWAETFGAFDSPIFHGPVVVIVTAVWRAVTPVGETRGAAKANTPDVDNVTGKLVLDALSPEEATKTRAGYPGLWADDGQVAALSGVTRYAWLNEPPHTQIIITSIVEADDGAQGALEL